MAKITINEKIDRHFDMWCKLLPGAALYDAGLCDSFQSQRASEKVSNTTNEYLNDWEDVVSWYTQSNEMHVDFERSDLTLEALGKLRIMAIVSNALRGGKGSSSAKMPEIN